MQSSQDGQGNLMPRSGLAIGLTAGFFGLILAARAWFQLAPQQPTDKISLRVRQEIQGWQFTPESISPAAQEILATTNLLNGMFSSPQGDTVLAFAAHWSAADSRSMSVVQHTPDICWVGAGWKPAQVGQPQQLEVRLGSQTIPFECRAFTPPGGLGRQLVFWCTLVGGQVLKESDRWHVAEEDRSDGLAMATASSRRLGANQFLRNIAERRSASGEKQFVRCSVAVKGDDWELAVRQLQAFAVKWLEVENP